jgi:aryl-alcohol dehydrogenase-like predicted oxidoreductase
LAAVRQVQPEVIFHLAAQPLVASVISGATSPEQMSENIKAVGWRMSSEDLAEIDKITKH